MKKIALLGPFWINLSKNYHTLKNSKNCSCYFTIFLSIIWPFLAVLIFEDLGFSETAHGPIWPFLFLDLATLEFAASIAFLLCKRIFWCNAQRVIDQEVAWFITVLDFFFIFLHSASLTYLILWSIFKDFTSHFRSHFYYKCWGCHNIFCFIIDLV